ncbi:MAG: signal peptidase II [Gemmatimonadota bacterium]
MKRKLSLVGAVFGSILVADIVTKHWALANLLPGYSREAFGGLVPLTLAFNKGIAFGIGLPSAGRWIIVAASFFVLAVLLKLLLRAEERDALRLLAIAAVSAGAVGNLIDRLRWDRGVVDFLGPYDLGFMTWPIFNVADMAITSGAVLLGISLWMEDARVAAAQRAAAAGAVESATTGGGVDGD